MKFLHVIEIEHFCYPCVKIGPESDQAIGSELQNALSNYVIIFGNIT